MAGKLSEMPSAGLLTGNETLEIIQDGANKKLTVADLIGNTGTDGKSAYELAVQAGYNGTVDQWVASLKGSNGTTGTAGLSAFDLALGLGYQGNLTQWLASLKGADGVNGTIGAKGDTGAQGPQGLSGLSAYQLARNNGFTGDMTAWLASLQGAKGDPGDRGLQGLQGAAGTNGTNGTNGQSAYDVAVAAGFQGNRTVWLASLVGAAGPKGDTGLTGPQGPTGAAGASGTNGVAGQSAFDLAVSQGYSGSLTNWLASLKGATGATGAQGLQGLQGPAGTAGATGPQGVKGDTGNTGAAGPTGATGAQGLTGPAGAIGPAGAQGATGAAGPQGLQGIQGLQGLTGATGAAGPQGPKGDTGATGPAGTNGTAGTSTTAQITDATTLGRSLITSADKPTARAALAAVGYDASTKVWDGDSKISLSNTGVNVPGVINGVDYGIDWTGATATGAAFQNWINAAATMALARVNAVSKSVFVKLVLPPGAAPKLDQAITLDIGLCHLDLNHSNVTFTNSASAGFIVKSSGFDVGVQAMYHQGKNVLCNGVIIGPGRNTTTNGVLFQGNVPPYAPYSSYYEQCPAGAMVSCLSVFNFGVGLMYDYFTYLITLFRVDVGSCKAGMSVGANFAGGERFAIIGSNIAGCDWAIDFSVSTNSEWFFENCSLDYCSQFIRWNGPVQFNFIQTHFEHGGAPLPMIVSMSGNQNGGIQATMCDFISTNINTYPSYMDLKDMNYFDADKCFVMALKGLTNELCSTYTTRAIVGTTAMTANSAVVTGTSTTFTSTAAVGDVVVFSTSAGLVKLGNGSAAFTSRIKSIESDTSLTLFDALPATILIGAATSTVTSFTGGTLTANTSQTPWGGRVRLRNSKYGPNDFKSQLFVGGSITKNYVMYDTNGSMPYGFVQQNGGMAINTMTWSGGLVTVTLNNPHAIPAGATMRCVVNGATPSLYNGEHNCTQTGANTFTFPLGQDPGAVTVKGTFSFANPYGIRLGTSVGIQVVPNSGGYASIRKMSTYTGNPQALWMFIPIPSAAFRNIVWGYDEVAIGAVGQVHPLTRWGSIPNLNYSYNGTNVPDDANYNTNFGDYGGYTPPAVETTHIFNVPDYGTYGAAPEWATHFVVKFDLSALAIYQAGAVEWKIRNIRLSMS